MFDFKNDEELQQMLGQAKTIKKDLRGAAWSALGEWLIAGTLAGVVMVFCLLMQRSDELLALAAKTRDLEALLPDIYKILQEQLTSPTYAEIAVIVTMIFAVLGMIPYLIYARRRQMKLGPLLDMKGVDAKKLGLMALAVIGLNNLSGFGMLATELAFNSIGYTIIVDMSMDDTVLSFWLMNVYAILLGPIIEEVLYRGILIEGLKKYGEYVAIMGSAVIFGMAHGNLMQFLPTVCIGFLLGYIRVKTGSLTVTIILHALNNLYATLYSEIAARLPQTQLVSMLDFALTVVLCVLGVIEMRKLYKEYGRIGEAPEGTLPVGIMAFLSIPMLAFVYFVFDTVVTAITPL